MNTLNHIRNFLRIDDGLATSGMPRPDDFAALRQAGFAVVVNLPGLICHATIRLTMNPPVGY